MLIRPSTIIGVSIVVKRSRFAIAVFVFEPVYSYVMWDHFVNTCTQVGPKIPGNSTGGGIRQSLNLFAIRRVRRDKTDPVIRPTMILKYFGRSLLQNPDHRPLPFCCSWTAIRVTTALHPYTQDLFSIPSSPRWRRDDDSESETGASGQTRRAGWGSSDFQSGVRSRPCKYVHPSFPSIPALFSDRTFWSTH